MVRILKIIFLTVLLLPAFANAQEVSFEAYIDRESVAAGETFQVKLELINANATAAPNLAAIPPEISIIGQQQQVSSTFINGVTMNNVSWVLDLVSDKEGTYKIPAIEINTNSGMLYTKPFRIYVKPATQISTSTSDNSVFIDTQVEKNDPYITEPISYKTTVYYLGEMNNAELVKPKVENAIVEQISQPKPSRQILNGINYKMIDVEYMITPVRTGDITIEPTVLRGKMAREMQGTPMDSMFSALGGMQGREFVPFTVASKETKITAKEAEPDITPWLVLYDLQIDEEVGNVNYDQDNNRIIATAGEPISRRIRVTASGKEGEALPDLETFFNSPDFKVYADKADNTKEVMPGTGPLASRIKGTRTQTFTFIPQKAGMISLPELNISYWNLKDSKMAKANLPGKVITVMDADKNAATDDKATPEKPVEAQPVVAAATQPEQPTQPQSIEEKLKQVLESPQAPNLVLLLMSFIICVIIFVSFKILTSAKKNRVEFDEDITDLQAAPERKFGGRKIVDDPKAKNLIDINRRKIIDSAIDSFDPGFTGKIRNAGSAVEIQEALQNFASRYLNVSPNSGTILIAQALNKKFGTDKHSAMKYAAELDSVIYAGKQIDLSYLKNGFADIISQAEAKLNSSTDDKGDDDKLVSLNP